MIMSGIVSVIVNPSNINVSCDNSNVTRDNINVRHCQPDNGNGRLYKLYISWANNSYCS